MSEQGVKEILEKQLQVLFEHSEACLRDGDLANISSVMLQIAEFLLSDRYTSRSSASHDDLLEFHGTEVPMETMLKSIQKTQKVAQKATDDIAEQ